MSLINTLLQDYRLNREITGFLLELKAKAVAASPYKIDELYAIMPPLEICWQTENPAVKLHQLEGILTIQTQWDIYVRTSGVPEGSFSVPHCFVSDSCGN